MPDLVVLDQKSYAKRLGIDARTLKKMMLEFDIPHIKLQRKILFPVESADMAIKRIAEDHIENSSNV